MKQFSIRFDKTHNIVLALILPPMLIIPLIVVMAVYFPHLPDWVIGGTIAVFMVLILVYTLLLVKRLSPKGVLLLYPDRFVVEFPNKTAFTPRDFEIMAQDIEKCVAGVTQAGFYLRFVTSVTPRRFNLSAGSKNDDDTEAFEDLMRAIGAMLAGRYSGWTPPKATADNDKSDNLA